MKVRFLHPAIGAFAVRLPEDGEMTVGRDGASADIEISWDPQISRRHARLSLEGGRLFLEDLGSRNGCWHGQQRLQGRVRLDPGTSVLLGETALLVPTTLDEASAVDPTETFEAIAPLTHAWVAADAATQPHTELAEIDLFSQDLDVDLPEPAAPSPPPVVGTPSPRRERAYFATPSRVTLRADRTELARLWLEELSKGGLFVPTDTPPPVGSHVEVRFDLEGSPLDLGAEVVALVPASEGGTSPAGVGLALPELLGAKGATLSAFIEGRTADVPGVDVPDAPKASTADLEHALERAAEILSLTERGQLYAALRVTPECEPRAIVDASARARAALRDARPGALPPQLARLDAATQALERAEKILGDPATRLEHDFRTGHVRPHARVAAARAGAGPSVAELRRVWNRVHADQIELAARVTREAFQARQERDLARAVECGQRALELNPFFEELEKTVEVWKQLLKA